MGQKKLLYPYSLVTNGVMTGTAVITSPAVDVLNFDNHGLQVHWTGTPTGNFEVQVSNDGTTYDTLTFEPLLAQPAGSASGYAVNLNQISWKWLRVRYTNASGTGVLNVTIVSRDLN